MENKELLEIYNQVKHLPNVVGVAFGKKMVSGEITTTPSVIVKVKKKYFLLNEEDAVPRTLNGYPTDVIVTEGEVNALTINSDYIYASTAGNCTSGFNCRDKDNVITPCGSNCLDNLTQRQIFLHDEVGSDNHNGRIIMGGMSGIGHLTSDACSGMCTLTLVCKDNVDNTPVILGNQHCMHVLSGSPSHYIMKQDISGINVNSWTQHVALQNTRVNASQLLYPYNALKLVHPAAKLTSVGGACSEPCELDDLTNRKFVGEIKATVFISRNVGESPAFDATPTSVTITAPVGVHPVTSGTYSLSCWGGITLSSQVCTNGLSCLEREYINSTPGYVITHSGQTYDKVPECGNVDSAIWKVKSNSGSTAVIPLPGIVDLGDGPFDWITKDEFFDLINELDDVYVYKSGARRGTVTHLQYAKVVSYDPEIFANVGIKYKIKNVVKCYASQVDLTQNVVSEGGDSGSPVLVYHDGQLKILGILSWGNCTGEFFVAPIWDIADTLNISPWLENTNLAVVEADDASITIAGRPFTKTILSAQQITHNKD